MGAAPRAVAAGAATTEHLATGKIDQATRRVGELVETKTKERGVETIQNGTPVAISHDRHVEGVDTGVVSAGAKEVGEVVETHTTRRDLNRAHNLKTSRELNGSQEIAPMSPGIVA